MWNVLVTGANRGIGFEFVRQLAEGTFHSGTTNIIATCRDPENAKELRAINTSDNVKVHILKLDVCKDSDVEKLVPAIQNLLGPTEGLNLLINNAGYAAMLNLNETTREEMDKVFSINVTSPLMVAKALLPLLRLAAEHSPKDGMSCFKSAVVNISSIAGSFGTPLEGARRMKLMAYGTSKAALNLWTRYFAKDVSKFEILVTLLHPGWVQTDMGRMDSMEPPLTPQQSISDMMATIISWTLDHHGGFFDKDGKVIPW